MTHRSSVYGNGWSFASSFHRNQALLFLLGFGTCYVLRFRLPITSLSLQEVPLICQSQKQLPTKLQCAKIVPAWIWFLHRHEKKIFSQYGEDGITEKLIEAIPPIRKYYVEFGTEGGSECNTRVLRDNHKWTGLLMDGGNENNAINLHKEMIHPDNIVDLFKKYDVPKEPDYLSEDTDFADYWLWKAILEAGYHPRIVESEINSNFLTSEGATVHGPAPNQTRFWTGSNYFGVSALGLKHLWNKHGYTMVYCTESQVNCFGVRTDLLNLSLVNITPEVFQDCLWEKPLAISRKIHSKDLSFETFCWINEAGDVISEDFVASFSQFD